MSINARPRPIALVALTASLLAACSSAADPTGVRTTPPPPPAAMASGSGLSVAVASFDLAVGDDQRFIAGLFTDDRQLIGLGEVQMRFFHLGDQTTADPEPLTTTTATFLPVPGKEPEGDSPNPILLEDPQAAGVYETTVDLPRTGFYGVAVAAEIDGERLVGTASFQVHDEHQVPAVGDQAPRSDNLTLDSDVPPAAIDSRAGTDGDIPDPHLHDTTIAEAIEADRPAVVVFSTPVYCVSRFCGPITDAVAELVDTYADRAAFIHVEVWRDFDAGQLNGTAAEWIQTPDGGNEPWVFLIDGDGRIAARWDNVLDRAHLEQLLDDLPAAPA